MDLGNEVTHERIPMLTRIEFERCVHGEALRLSSSGIKVSEIRTSVVHVHDLRAATAEDVWSWRAIVTPARDTEISVGGKTPELCIEALRLAVRNAMASSGDSAEQLSASEIDLSSPALQTN